MTTPEKGFWHKTKEVGGNLWEGTKNVTEDVWEGTKNMADGIKNAFSADDEEDLREEIHYASGKPDDIYEDIEIAAKSKSKFHNRATKH